MDVVGSLTGLQAASHETPLSRRGEAVVKSQWLKLDGACRTLSWLLGPQAQVSMRSAWLAATSGSSSQVSPGAAIHSLCWFTLLTQGSSINCMAGLAPKHATNLLPPAGLSRGRLLGGSIDTLQVHHYDSSLQGKAPAASRVLASARPSSKHFGLAAQSSQQQGLKTLGSSFNRQEQSTPLPGGP